jgi:hypothetical protein
MRRVTVFLAALAFASICCSREPYGTVTHRTSTGSPDQWLYSINQETYEVLIDTNGDGRPDVVKTFKDHQLVSVERDRDFNGKIDLVQEYSHGVMAREIHDDDFDGKTEKIETYRRDGTLAIVERDPREHGAIDSVEYYDDSGKLIRREVRGK